MGVERLSSKVETCQELNRSPGTGEHARLVEAMISFLPSVLGSGQASKQMILSYSAGEKINFILPKSLGHGMHMHE